MTDDQAQMRKAVLSVLHDRCAFDVQRSLTFWELSSMTASSHKFVPLRFISRTLEVLVAEGLVSTETLRDEPARFWLSRVTAYAETCGTTENVVSLVAVAHATAETQLPTPDRELEASDEDDG